MKPTRFNPSRLAESAPFPASAEVPAALSQAATELLAALGRLAELQPAYDAVDLGSDPDDGERFYKSQWEPACERLWEAERELCDLMSRAEVPAFLAFGRLFVQPGLGVDRGLPEELSRLAVVDSRKALGLEAGHEARKAS